MYQLEDRILFDGAAAIDVAEVAEQAEEIQQELEEAQHEAEQQAQSGDEANQPTAPHNAADAEHSASDDVPLAADLGDGVADPSNTNVLVISDALENADELFDSAASETIVVRYDAQSTTAGELIALINDALEGEKADTIGFAVETKDGAELTIFSDETTAYETINSDVQQDFWDGIEDVMDADGRIDILSSSLTATERGETLVNAIAEATDHEVAASNNLTGATDLGGDWTLEHGDVDISDIYFDGATLGEFDSVMDVEARHEVAFFNSSVMNADEIIDDLGDNVDIVMLDGIGDGIEEITEYLNNANSEFDDIHIFTHGNEGYFVLNGEVIDDAAINEHFADFASWRNVLSDTADINIFGCRLAANDAGQQLIADLGAATGADIAAATDDVGGSDWTLDYQFGLVDPVALGITDYDYQLADQLVTSALDDGSAGTLRLAVSDVGDGQSITFAADLGGSSIVLASVIEIDHSMTISGFQDADGTNAITVSGDNLTQIFNVTGADTFAALENLNLVSGNGDDGVGGVDGGAISNSAALSLNHIILDSNFATGNGGAVYNTGLLMSSNDTLFVRNGSIGDGGAVYNDGGQVLLEQTYILSNGAVNGGAIYNNSGEVQLVNSTIWANTADDHGGGIYNSGSLTMENVTIASNAADGDGDLTGDGGGIYNDGGHIYALNTTISNNSAVTGSALYQVNPVGPGAVTASTTFEQSTVALNVNTAIDGEGLFYYADSIVAGGISGVNDSNNGFNYRDDLTNGSDLFVGGAGASPTDNGGWVPTLELDTTKAIVISDIVDASSNAGASIYDARGYMRHGARDIGAFESDAYMAANISKGFYYTNVQAAIDDAQAGEEIELFATRYALSSAWTIDQDLILTGQGVGETVLDGGNATQLLIIDDGDVDSSIAVRVVGMSLMNGNATVFPDDRGGAIYSSENLMMSHVAISNSQAGDGGAIFNDGGYLYLERADLYSNSAIAAGGALFNDMGQVRIIDSSIYDNSSDHGGGIYSYDDGTGVAALTIDRAAIYNNSALAGGGGAIYANGGQKVELTNVTIAYNEARFGGAMYFDGNGTWKFTNITVAYNETTTAGEYAITFIDAGGGSGGYLFALNTLALGNTDAGVVNDLDIYDTADGINLTTSNVYRSVVNGRDAVNNPVAAADVFTDGVMADHGGWSYSLAIANNTVVVNQGTDMGVPTYDQRGYESNGIRDIGAYEYDGIVAFYSGFDATGKLITGEASTISEAGTALTGDGDPAALDIILINSRILESDITIESWKMVQSGASLIPTARVVNIYGGLEGDTVIDGGYNGVVMDVIGTRYTASGATTPTYVMGTVNVERLALTGGFTSGSGAAITTTHFSGSGSINLSDVALVDNVALGNGGAIYVEAKPTGGYSKDQADATYTLNNTLVADNIAGGSGGGIATRSATALTLNSSTVADNRSFRDGGGLALLDIAETGTGAVNVNNSTISFNIASERGGGVYNAGKLGAVSSIFARNRATGFQGSDYSLAHNTTDGKAIGALTEGYGNLVEYQNGHWVKDVSTQYFGVKDDQGALTQRTVLLGDNYYGIGDSYTYTGEYLFANDRVSDNGGWTGTIALDYQSAAEERGSGGDDQRHFSANRTRDIGAYELNGIVATVGGFNFTDLASAVQAAGDGDTVLVNNTRIEAHDIQIGSNITIETANAGATFYDIAVIDSGRLGRAFSIEGNTVTATLANLLLTNGMIMVGSGQGGQAAGGVGGTIFNAGNLTLNEVSITNSVAQLSGGAIYSTNVLNISSNASLKIADNSSNYAAFMSGNRAESRGGAIFASGSLTVSGSQYDGSLLNMYHFIDNNAYSGGAIYGDNLAAATEGSFLFDAVIFSYNNSVDRGGAVTLISDSELLVNKSEFSLNSSMRYGGALYAESSQALTFSDSSFIGNFAFSDGGALYFDGLNSSDAVLTVYSALGTRQVENVFEGVTIISNYSLAGDGGAFYIANAGQFHTYSETLELGMSYFNNYAYDSGGAIFITNSGMADNAYAVVLGDVYDPVQNNHNEMSFSENFAGNNGGALYLENSGSFFAEENIDASYNFAVNNGGAFYIINSGNVIYRNSSNVYQNTAANSGGGFYIENSGDVTIAYTVLADNDTWGWGLSQGGGIFLKGNADVNFTDFDVYDNDAVGEGGGVYLSNDANLVDWLTTVDTQGETIYTSRLMIAPETVTVDGTLLTMGTDINSLTNGQWAYDSANNQVVVKLVATPVGQTTTAVVNAATLTINSSSFDRNSSGIRGGALYIDHAAQVDITNSSFGFNNNTALYLGYGNLNLNFTTFAYNLVGGLAGTDDAIGIYLAGDDSATAYASSFTINNSIMHDSNVGGDAPIRLGDTVTVTAGDSMHNIFTYFDQFQGTQINNLTDGSYSDITAYLPYGAQDGDITQTAAVLDGYGNIVGLAATTSGFVDANLYLASDMGYHANRRSRAMAIESINSIAYRYELNGVETRSGMADTSVTYDQRGNMRSGMQVLDIHFEYNSVSGEWSKVTLLTDGQIISSELSTEADALASGTVTKDGDVYTYFQYSENATNPAAQGDWEQVEYDTATDITTFEAINAAQAISVTNFAYYNYITLTEGYAADTWSAAVTANEYMTNVTLGNAPDSVTAGGVQLTNGTLGALAEGEWAMSGSNVVVRLIGDADPSTLGNDYVQYTYADNADYAAAVWQDAGYPGSYVADIELNSKPTVVYADGVWLQESTLGSLQENQWAMDGDRMIIRLAGDVDPSTLADGAISYTLPSTWAEQIFAEDGSLISQTAVAVGDVPTSIGAFEANFYATVTSNADHDSNPYAYYNVPEWSYMDRAIDGGMTLREGVYWLDTYSIDNLGADSNMFDAERYVKFSDSMFATPGTSNLITLTANDIRPWTDVTVGMTDHYQDAYYTDNGGEEHYFSHDNSFRAQDDASRIIVDGANEARIWEVRERHDYSSQGGYWSFTATLGLNNITMQNGEVLGISSDLTRILATLGEGGAIYNDGTMHLNNTVVQDSVASNDGNPSGNGMAYGGGIYNSGIITISDSTITGNQADGSHGTGANNAGLGGGLYNASTGTMLIERSLIGSDNQRGGEGSEGNYVTSVATTTQGFGSATGGGIYSIGDLTMLSSTVSGNYITADSSHTVNGSAITIAGGNANLYGNTIVYNDTYNATTPGYAVYLANGNIDLQNNIIAENYIASDPAPNRRDIYVTGANLSAAAGTDYRNIIGKYAGTYDFYANKAISGDIIGKQIDPNTGLVEDLNLSTDLLYNGGITRNYRVETGSVAIAVGDYANLDPALNLYVGADGYRDDLLPGNNRYIADQRNLVGNAFADPSELQYRQTIGAYEMLTYVSVDSDTPDAALPADGITYDFANARPGWEQNLRNALYLADQGALVEVNAITGVGNNIFTLTEGELLIANAMTVVGIETDPAYSLIIDGQGLSRIFAVSDTNTAAQVTVKLENMTLINGYADAADRGGLGGTIYSTEGLELNNVTITDSAAASHGGAIYQLAGGLTLTDTTISNATSDGFGGAIFQQTDAFDATGLIITDSTAAGSGGAIYIADGSSFTLDNSANTNSVLSGNSAGNDGGAIAFNGGDLTITAAYLHDNSATGSGGGLFVNSAGNITIDTTTFGSNSAETGGGLFVSAGSTSFVNSTLSGNTATKSGGAIYFDGSTLSLTYVTVANNIAGYQNNDGVTYQGGGVYMANGTLNMTNTIVAQNYRQEIADTNRTDLYFTTTSSQGNIQYSVIGASNWVIGGIENIIMGTDAAWSDLGVDTELADNNGPTPTLYIYNTSVAVGNGLVIATSVDQRGEIRATGIKPDGPTIGAYEKVIHNYYFVDTLGDGDITNLLNWNDNAGGGGGIPWSFANAVDSNFIFDDDVVALNAGQTWTVDDRSIVYIDNGTGLPGNPDVTIAATAIMTAYISVGGNGTLNVAGTYAANSSQTIEVAGQLNIAGGTVTVAGAQPSADIKLTDNGLLKIATDDANVVNMTINSMAATSTVSYSLVGDQTIKTLTHAPYQNLEIAGGGTKTATSDLTVFGNLTMADNATVNSGINNLTVSGTTAGIGNIAGNNINLAATALTGDISGTNDVALNGVVNVTGNITGGNDVNFAGATTVVTGNITGGNDVNLAGTATTVTGNIAGGNDVNLTGATTTIVGDVQATNLVNVTAATAADITGNIQGTTVQFSGAGNATIRSGRVTATTITADNQLNLDNAELVAPTITLNAPLTTVAGTIVNVKNNRIEVATLTLNGVTVNDYSILTIDTGASDVNLNTTGVGGINVNDFTVATNGALNFATTGDISTAVMVAPVNLLGALALTGNDIDLTGGAKFTNAEWLILDNSGTLTLGNTVEAKNIAFNGPVQLNADAVITSGSIIINGLVTGNDYDLTLNATTGSITVANADGIKDFIINANDQAGLGDITASSLTVKAPNGIVLDGTIAVTNAVELSGPIIVDGDASVTADTISSPGGLVIDGSGGFADELTLNATSPGVIMWVSGVGATSPISLTVGNENSATVFTDDMNVNDLTLHGVSMMDNINIAITGDLVSDGVFVPLALNGPNIAFNGVAGQQTIDMAFDALFDTFIIDNPNGLRSSGAGVLEVNTFDFAAVGSKMYLGDSGGIEVNNVMINMSPTSYFVTDGTGMLYQQVGAAAMKFIVGSDSYYYDVDITQAANGWLGISSFDSVTANSTIGGAPITGLEDSAKYTLVIDNSSDVTAIGTGTNNPGGTNFDRFTAVPYFYASGWSNNWPIGVQGFSMMDANPGTDTNPYIIPGTLPGPNGALQNDRSLTIDVPFYGDINDPLNPFFNRLTREFGQYSLFNPLGEQTEGRNDGPITLAAYNPLYFGGMTGSGMPDGEGGVDIRRKFWFGVDMGAVLEDMQLDNMQPDDMLPDNLDNYMDFEDYADLDLDKVQNFKSRVDTMLDNLLV